MIGAIPPPPPMARPRLQCRALMVALVLETVREDGEVIAEAVTPPQKMLRAYWPDLPETVAQLVDELNASKGQE